VIEVPLPALKARQRHFVPFQDLAARKFYLFVTAD